MKKVLSILLVVCMVMSMVTIIAIADGESVTVTLENGVISNGKTELSLNMLVKGAFITTTIVFALDLPEGCEVDLDSTNWAKCSDWNDDDPEWQFYVFDSNDQTSFYKQTVFNGTESVTEHYFKFKVEPKDSQAVLTNFVIPLKGVSNGAAQITASVGGEPYVSIKKTTTQKKVTLTKFSDDSVTIVDFSNGSTASSTEINASSITDSTKGAATVSGTVTDGKATLNVACDKACVVAYTTDDGATYTPVSAVQADSGYNFVVPDYSENMKFVVAVKGDVNGDGILDSTDTGQVKAVQLGKIKTFTALQTLAADLDGNGTIESTEAGQIKAAQLGKIQLAW